MIHKILVGIDDSEHAEKTLQRAREIQKNLGCEMVIFHSVEHYFTPVVFPSFTPSRVYVVESAANRQFYIKKGKEILKKAKEVICDNDSTVETRLILDDNPEEYITNICKEENFDLVVIGSQGEHRMIERLGSVSEKVLHKSECDVMIVK